MFYFRFQALWGSQGAKSRGVMLFWGSPGAKSRGVMLFGVHQGQNQGGYAVRGLTRGEIQGVMLYDFDFEFFKSKKYFLENNHSSLFLETICRIYVGKNYSSDSSRYPQLPFGPTLHYNI